MIIVDTTVWVDYLRGVMTPETNWLELELSRQPIGLTDLILCEVLQGIKAEAQFEATRRELLKCEVFTMGGISFAITAARNYQRLRSGGLYHTPNR
jgi:predicted nucleic acid-binding protein